MCVRNFFYRRLGGHDFKRRQLGSRSSRSLRAGIGRLSSQNTEQFEVCDAGQENAFEFDDGRVVLRPLAAALDLAQCGLQDLKKMAGL